MENLSAAVKLPIKKGCLGNPTLGTNLGMRIGWMLTARLSEKLRSLSGRGGAPSGGGQLALALIIIISSSSSSIIIVIIIIIIIVIIYVYIYIYIYVWLGASGKR